MAEEIESWGLNNPDYPNNVISCIGGREENQDSCGIWDTRRGLLALVCDGMGGMAGGATASKIAISTISQYIMKPQSEDDTDEDNLTAIIKAVRLANAAILSHASENPSLTGMGSTATALLIDDDKAVVAHVGDSRIYQLRGGRKKFRTFDHSMVFEMVKKKIITEEQARLSSQSNIILRALGQKEDVDVEARELCYDKDDVFLLCTDGVWGTMPESELIARTSIRQHPKVVTETLAIVVNQKGKEKGGGHDNLTAAVIKTTKDSKTRSKMEEKIKKALIVCLAALLVSIVANVILIVKLF